MNFQTVAAQYLHDLENSSNPRRPSTLQSYRSVIKVHLARFNSLELAELAEQNNRLLRDLVKDLRARYKPASIRQTLLVFRSVLESVVDMNGNRVFRPDWNWSYVGAPIVNPREQRAPIIPTDELNHVVANHRCAPLFALLAGTGLRIGEALALTVGDWDKNAGLLHIRASKTPAGVREVDLPMDLNTWLQARINFATPDSKLFRGNFTTWRQRARGVTGFAHGFRRFRLTHLRRVGAPEDLLRFWIGHSDKTISDRYSRIRCDREFRRQQVERAGLGFSL